MSETDKIQLMADNVSLTSTVAERDAEIATHATTIEGLEKAKNAQDVKIATQATTIEGLEKAKNDKDIEIATQATTIDTQATTIKGLEKAKLLVAILFLLISRMSPLKVQSTLF